MRMVVLGIALGELEAPGAVVAHDRMHEVAFHQPVENAIQGDAVKGGFLGQGLQYFMMREWEFRLHQNIQYGNT